jgi:hypothetical protein
VDQLEVNLVYRNDRFYVVEITPLAKMVYRCSFCEMNENFDHQHQDLRTENAVKYGDLPEFMDFEYLRKIAASNLATLANLAWAPKPTNVGIEVKLTNFSTLVWKAENKKKKVRIPSSC